MPPAARGRSRCRNWLPAWRLAALLLMVGCLGCTRTDYRYRADRDVYGIERERQVDPRWRLPVRPVEPDPRSRMDYRFDPDREPIPPDDPSARLYQVSRGRPLEYHGWEKRGSAPIEDPRWVEFLPRDDRGAVTLSQESVLPLALLNSRDYQTQVEGLYLNALGVAQARFEFMAQPFSRSTLVFTESGAGPTSSRLLNLDSQNGATLNLLSGGQFAATLSNALLWEFAGDGFNRASSSLLVSFTQPLLRGAMIRIRTQGLSLAERQMLYSVREFAQFRREFYVTVLANGYLGLLTQLQGIRNTRENLDALRRNLDEQDNLLRLGMVDLASRDQVAINFQNSQLQLISSEAGLQSTLDGYKLSLGLPPELRVSVDEALLRQFELSNPRLDALRRRGEALNLELLNINITDTPSAAELAGYLDRVDAGVAELREIIGGLRDEYRRFREDLGLPPLDDALPPALPENRTGTTTPAELADRIAGDVSEVEHMLDAVEAESAAIRAGRRVPRPTAALAEDEQADKLEYVLVQELISQRFLPRVSDVLVLQSQVRVQLIELPEVTVTTGQAIEIALANRPDLMNARARVTDTWRGVEVAANALLPGLELQYSSSLATDPSKDTLLRLDASASSHRVGVGFDAPVNRYLERNAYRSAQIGYQQSRRAYMLQRDAIVQQIRLDVRTLLLARRRFEITREQVILAARAVEQAEINVRTTRDVNAGAGQTTQLLDVLNRLLDARNALIGNYVEFVTARMALFRDLGIMDIDAQGAWTNERIDLDTLAPRAGQPGDLESELAPDLAGSDRTEGPDTGSGAVP